MKIPHICRRRRQREGSAARVVALDSPGSPDEVMTSIPRPDALLPVEHVLTALVPGQADLELAVTQQIRELHEAGALDEGTAWVLDRHIEFLAAVWCGRIHQELEPRRMTAARLVAADEDNLRRESGYLLKLYRELHEAKADYGGLRAEALGVADPEPEPTGPEPIVDLPGLPTGGDLHQVLEQSRRRNESAGGTTPSF